MAGVIIKLKSIVQFILIMNWRFDFQIIYSYGFQKFKAKLADKETREKD